MSNACSLDFNPRLREGGDPTGGHPLPKKIISIHASEKEATISLDFHALMWVISIHASEKEATANRIVTIIPDDISIHASEKEATTFWSVPVSSRQFQSTPPRRRRRSTALPSQRPVLLFQSTPPRRRRLIQQERRMTRWKISIHASEKEATTFCTTNH